MVSICVAEPQKRCSHMAMIFTFESPPNSVQSAHQDSLPFFRAHLCHGHLEYMLQPRTLKNQPPKRRRLIPGTNTTVFNKVVCLLKINLAPCSVFIIRQPDPFSGSAGARLRLLVLQDPGLFGAPGGPAWPKTPGGALRLRPAGGGKGSGACGILLG